MSDTHILTGTRDRRAQLWALNSKLNFSTIFSVELKNTVLRALYFNGEDIIVFGMYNGEIGKDGLLLSMKPTGLMIGGAALDENGYFIVDNAVSRFSLHRLDDCACVRSFNIKPTKTYPKQVTFVEGGKMVVGGSDSGIAHVFEKRTGKLVQNLKHSAVGRVQTITSHDEDFTTLIALASSSNEDVHISVWKKTCRTVTSSVWSRGFRTTIQVMTHLIAMVVVILVIQGMNQQNRYGMTHLMGPWQRWNKLWYQSEMGNDVRILLEQAAAQQTKLGQIRKDRISILEWQRCEIEELDKVVFEESVFEESVFEESMGLSESTNERQIFYLTKRGVKIEESTKSDGHVKNKVGLYA